MWYLRVNPRHNTTQHKQEHGAKQKGGRTHHEINLHTSCNSKTEHDVHDLIGTIAAGNDWRTPMNQSLYLPRAPSSYAYHFGSHVWFGLACLIFYIPRQGWVSTSHSMSRHRPSPLWRGTVMSSVSFGSDGETRGSSPKGRGCTHNVEISSSCTPQNIASKLNFQFYYFTWQSFASRVCWVLCRYCQATTMW